MHIQWLPLLNTIINLNYKNFIQKGLKIIIPTAKPRGLFGHWSFDEIQVNNIKNFILNKKILDHSGNNNHAKNQIKTGPSFLGVGNSAYFDGYDFLEIPHSSDFMSKELSITFWLFIIKELTEGTF